ncbi:ferritin [Clostridium bovifaecis]|uniref:Ferritin n=1 Tax=Clostridium bovifaecis TaxID=2184719 RepID=A0A6I6F829_9CLOT|nr:ferritin [Clostridium bovifaecis]
MISEKLMQKLNEQITYELFSAHLYLAMAAYCASQDLDGFSNFFKVQAEEERFHAMKFFNYVNEREGNIKLTGFDAPKNEFASILNVFEEGYEHEREVTRRIYELSDISLEEREHATISLLKWFIDEQVEEEASFNTLIKKLKRIDNDSTALYMLDAELAQRSFTPPVEA